MKKDSIPVLILSTGRTGTTFFSRLLNELYADYVDAYHERGHSRPVQILTNLHFAGLFPWCGVELVWALLKGHELSDCEKLFHIDSNNFMYGLASKSPHLYPSLRVVHIIRDPRAYVTSHLNYSKLSFSSFVANHLIPFWQPSPFLTGRISWTQYFSFSRFEQYSWIWEFKNNVVEALQQSEVPYLRIRFEDLFNTDAPEEAFRKLTDFIGLPQKRDIQEYFLQRFNQAPKNTFPEWPNWTPNQCRRLKNICGERMAKYGYGKERAWLEKLESLE